MRNFILMIQFNTISSLNRLITHVIVRKTVNSNKFQFHTLNSPIPAGIQIYANISKSTLKRLDKYIPQEAHDIPIRWDYNNPHDQCKLLCGQSHNLVTRASRSLSNLSTHCPLSCSHNSDSHLCSHRPTAVRQSWWNSSPAYWMLPFISNS